MEFKDFENNTNDLIGKSVLYESGFSYSEKRNRSIRQITSVTKTGFKIKDHESLFNFNGYQKGLNGRMNMGTISKCELLTEDEANKLRLKWKAQKEENILRIEMSEKLKTMTYEQLLKMKEL